jgi:hypothetical protein
MLCCCGSKFRVSCRRSNPMSQNRDLGQVPAIAVEPDLGAVPEWIASFGLWESRPVIHTFVREIVGNALPGLVHRAYT